MAVRWRGAMVASWLGLWLVGSCGEARKVAPCPEGAVTCGCYRNGSCDSGLECRSNVCVELGSEQSGGRASGGTGVEPEAGVGDPGTGGTSAGGSPGGKGGSSPTGGAATAGGVSVAGDGGAPVEPEGGAPSGGEATGGGEQTGGTNEVGGSGSGGTSPATGGDGGSAGSPATGGTAGAPPTVCPLIGVPENAIVYDGGSLSGETCGFMTRPPLVGFSYVAGDGTASVLPMMGVDGGFPGEVPGRGGALDCAFHVSGAGFLDWGALAGFELFTDCDYDASAFTGVRLYLKGTTTGTHGAAYEMADNTVRVAVVTDQNTGDDDFGGWCPLSADWALCTLPFASMAQEGFGMALPAVNKGDIRAIVIKATIFGGAASVALDFWIDDVGFY